MSFLDSISDGIKNHFDKNREQREMMGELQRDADAQRLLAFREAFSENAKIVAIAQAKKDAAEMSGLRKLRATTRARNLSHSEPEPGTFFEKLIDFTKKNKARMHENLERTKEIRGLAERQKKESLVRKISEREARLGTNIRTGKSTWKM